MHREYPSQLIQPSGVGIGVVAPFVRHRQADIGDLLRQREGGLPKGLSGAAPDAEGPADVERLPELCPRP